VRQITLLLGEEKKKKFMKGFRKKKVRGGDSGREYGRDRSVLRFRETKKVKKKARGSEKLAGGTSDLVVKGVGAE